MSNPIIGVSVGGEVPVYCQVRKDWLEQIYAALVDANMRLKTGTFQLERCIRYLEDNFNLPN